MANTFQNLLRQNLPYFLRGQTYLSNQTSQLHSSGPSQRFWNLLHFVCTDKAGDFQKKRREPLTSIDTKAATHSDCSKSTKKPIYNFQSSKYAFIKDDVGLPLRSFFETNGCAREAALKPSSAELLSNGYQLRDKFQDKLPQIPLTSQRAPTFSEQCKFRLPCHKKLDSERLCDSSSKLGVSNVCNPHRSPKSTCSFVLKNHSSVMFHPYTKKSYFSTYGPLNLSKQNVLPKFSKNSNSVTQNSQLAADLVKIQNSQFHESCLRNRRRRNSSKNSSSDSKTGNNTDRNNSEKKVCTKGDKDKQQDEKSKKREGKTICTGSASHGTPGREICTKPRSSCTNPKRNKSPSKKYSDCKPNDSWKDEVCPSHPKGPESCSIRKPQCPKSDEPIGPSYRELEESFERRKRHRAKGTSEKVKDDCDVDESWKEKQCPGSSRGNETCSTKKPQCNDKPLKRSYSTATIFTAELLNAKPLFIPKRSIKSSKFTRTENCKDQNNNDQSKSKEELLKQEIQEMENCITSVKCGRRSKNNKKETDKPRKRK